MTEWISNVNIPAAQLMIGMGVPLHHIPDLRRLYGQVWRGHSQHSTCAAPLPQRHCPAAVRRMRHCQARLPPCSTHSLYVRVVLPLLPTQDPSGSGPIDFEAGERVAPAGHVVAVRITAGG